ncbi:hypothetical protein AZE42_07976 [Rhizopogon vesiculosus]|uniref:DUF6533 domain-containing protein n=1 Tax=Rhizopogon vesiculosus TaxID=180088 RepID=A0A1J8QSE2_9AGAM|nr:hypothetical protein AZE42_07976 [Rhizopogon vesiculosus]
MSDQLNENVINLYWNNYTSVVIFALISYEYLLLLEDEVKYVWVSVQLPSCKMISTWRLTRSPEKAVVTDDMPLPRCSISRPFPCAPLWLL